MLDDSDKNKRERKTISLGTKIQILDRLENGESLTSVRKHFGLPDATVRTIKRNEATIRKSVLSGTKLSTKLSSYTRNVIKEKMEKALIKWMENTSYNKILVDGNTIKQKALRIYKQIKKMEPMTSTQLDKKYEFSASTGWLTGFFRRYGLHNIKIKDEIKSADGQAAKEFLLKLARIIEDGRYTPDQVWNAAETGLFWKKLPSKISIAKVQKTISDSKATKDHVTFLFCSNASGDCLLKPLLVNRVLKPQSMKDVDLNNLPVYWMAHKKTWVTTQIFTEWFNKYFVPEVKCYMEEKNLEFKILLIVDNIPSHPVLEHPNVQFCFLPSNTACLIQPLDQGIISTFKAYYLKQILQYILDKLHNDKTLTVIDVWKEFCIMDCIKLAASALLELRPSTLNSCWKLIWPECVKGEDHLPPNSIDYSSIITLAHAIGGEGFDDLSFTDIDKMLVDKPLNEDELIEDVIEITNPSQNSDNKEEIPLTLSLAKEGLQLARKLVNHFLTHDHIVERAEQFKRDMSSCMNQYQELYNNLAKTKSQQLKTEFIDNKTSGVLEPSANFVQDANKRISSLEYDNDDQNSLSSESNSVVYCKQIIFVSESDSE